MSVVATGTARIRHATTGVVHTLLPDALSWDVDGAEERQMGSEITHVAQIDHPDLGELVWRLWEYPIGMENDRETDPGPHTVLENFSLSLAPEAVEDDDDVPELDEDDPRVAALIEWFGERYEDPAQRTPYVTAEGGFQYVYGGPYDAREVLKENFPETDEGVIDAAVDALEADGLTEWTRTPQPGDYGEDEEPPPEYDSVGQDGPDEIAAALQALPDPDPGPRFATDGQGRIELVGWSRSTSAYESILLEEVRQAASALATALGGTNGHTDLLAAVRRYAEGVEPAEVSVTRIYARGVALENAVDMAAGLVREGERPPVPAPASALLGALLELHGALVMTTDGGRALVEAAARYRRTPDAQAALERSVHGLADAVREAAEVFGPEARRLVAEAASETGRGPRPERSNQVTEGVLGGLLGGLGRVLKFTGAALMAKIVGDGLATTPAGVVATEGVTDGVLAAWNFVITHAEALRAFAAATTQDLSWLSRVTAWILARLQSRQSAPD